MKTLTKPFFVLLIAMLQKSGVYPEDIWTHERKQALDYLTRFYQKLTVFYDQAAKNGSGVLLAIE